MKKERLVISLLLLIILLPFAVCNAQSKIVNDTLVYEGQKYAVGDSVQLWYGSSTNKSFAFVFIGSGMSGVTLAPAGWNKSFVLIDKVYKANGKNYIRCKALDAKFMMGNKIFIDLEGAVDNKEVKVE